VRQLAARAVAEHHLRVLTQEGSWHRRAGPRESVIVTDHGDDAHVSKMLGGHGARVHPVRAGDRQVRARIPQRFERAGQTLRA
jgi:hypothetical protein